MRRMIMIVLCVSGCGTLPGQLETASGTANVSSASGDVQRPVARSDGVVATEASVSGTPEVSVGTLGRTIASLGNPGEPGLWLKTPLVSAERKARVSNPATGQAVEVTLIPIEGPRTAGSRMSLAAMQALGAPLGDLVEVDVFGF
ncbi:MAG: hypothetical protein ABJX32_21815 [Tateyamaria sp.]|uniref:hypothetical protein n=1 Tax=unclassified Tateyamaria TaxID=2645127 RepID=UPI00131F112F|nr:hypothetical protein [Tateyamaria sp. Alg231-49]